MSRVQRNSQQVCEIYCGDAHMFTTGASFERGCQAEVWRSMQDCPGGWMLRRCPRTTREVTGIVATEWMSLRGVETGTLSREEMRATLIAGCKTQIERRAQTKRFGLGPIWVFVALKVAEIVIRILIDHWWSE